METIVITRCAKRAVVIQLDCFVAPLLAMTVQISRDVGITRRGVRNALLLACDRRGTRFA